MLWPTPGTISQIDQIRRGQLAREARERVRRCLPECLVSGKRVLDRDVHQGPETREILGPRRVDLLKLMPQGRFRALHRGGDGDGLDGPVRPIEELARASAGIATGIPGGNSAQASPAPGGAVLPTPERERPRSGQGRVAAARWTAIAAPIECPMRTTPGEPGPWTAQASPIASDKSSDWAANEAAGASVSP